MPPESKSLSILPFHRAMNNSARLSCSVCAMAVLLAGSIWLQSSSLAASQIPVRHKEGLTHGLLTLSTLRGEKIADGEMKQVTKGDRVTGHLTFHFKDGSFYDQKTIFSQSGHFKLLSDRVIQRGPSFKMPMKTTIDTSTGLVTVRYKDGGKEKVIKKKLDLPPDISNGMVSMLTKDIEESAKRTTLSLLAFTPKPRLVKLVITPGGEQTFRNGSMKIKGLRYVVKVKIGGLSGVVAPLIGKQPPDVQIWILGGKAPAFVRSESPLGNGGPLWRTEMAPPAAFRP